MTEITAHHGMFRDTNLHVDDTGGPGRPVALIHGWPLSGEAFKLQVPALQEAGHRVVTYDRRGFGRSDKPLRGYTFGTLTEDLHLLLEQVPLRRPGLPAQAAGRGVRQPPGMRYRLRLGISTCQGWRGMWTASRQTSSVGCGVCRAAAGRSTRPAACPDGSHPPASGVDEASSGLVSGVSTTAVQIGGAIGIAVLATVAATTTRGAAPGTPAIDALADGYAAAFQVGALVIVLAVPIALALLRLKPTASTPASS